MRRVDGLLIGLVAEERSCRVLLELILSEFSRMMDD